VEQPELFTAPRWPALKPGPVFVCFELRGKPQHKARHRSRLMIPKDAWMWLPSGKRVITDFGAKKIFIMQHPDSTTEAYEKVLAEAGGLFMRGKPPTEKPCALLMHVFKPIPESWSKTEKEQARCGYLRPTSRPDDDNYLKIRDALDGVVWKEDSQCVDSHVLKFYSDRPALRIEVREMLPPAELSPLS
jgi:Holliday junction resolvase RusA-like endonuclease